MNDLENREILLRDIQTFCREAGGLELRSYQLQVAQAILGSVCNGRGMSFAVMFPRQSGKNELQAQLEAYLLTLLSSDPAEIVKISPTYKPQTVNAMRRLERVLARNEITRQSRWKKEGGYILRLGEARVIFFSGSPSTNIVGATASILLEVDEAQDIGLEKYDKEIAPMAASTNATRVFWGTAWTSGTLLARELRAAQVAQEQDGLRRAFVIDADVVGSEVPAYRAFVAGQVARLGLSHPMVQTQFFSREIESGGGLFPPGRTALLHGAHLSQAGPGPGSRPRALLIDLAGEEESPNDASPLSAGRRDATALTVVEVDLTTAVDPLLRRPTYLAIQRRLWTGVRHARLYAELRALALAWNARWVVVDATGVGAGLASFLGDALPGKVLPFIFSQVSKSKLGWDFLAVVDSGRWKEHRDHTPEQEEFYRQLRLCQYEIQPGPAKILSWGVPDGMRDAASGEPAHDDLLMSAALCAVLDRLEWHASGPTAIISQPDPLRDLDRGF